MWQITTTTADVTSLTPSSQIFKAHPLFHLICRVLEREYKKELKCETHTRSLRDKKDLLVSRDLVISG